jgi:inhibitor of cysteine peptidase
MSAVPASMRLALLLLAIVPLGTACGRTAAITVTAADGGSRVDLGTGQTLEVLLEGNPTTGYAWSVDELDDTVLALTGDPLYEAERDALGSGGTYRYRFEAIRSGETGMRLVYERPFEESPPEETFEITVHVRD